MMEVLAPKANAIHTNFSRSVSLSIIDQSGNEIPIETNYSYSIEMIIPRDPNVIISPMILQNITSLNQPYHMKVINLKEIQSNENLTNSIHFEIHPLTKNRSFLFIYQFDRSIQFDHLDRWILFCPSSK
jgi:hypothetical protein